MKELSVCCDLGKDSGTPDDSTVLVQACPVETNYSCDNADPPVCTKTDTKFDANGNGETTNHDDNEFD